MSHIALRVVKLGGSLLCVPDLNVALTRWIEHDLAICNLIVVGGGEIVEAVRTYDRIHECPAAEIHQVCIDLLDTSARLLNILCPQLPIVSSTSELEKIVASTRSNTESWGPMSLIVTPTAFKDLNPPSFDALPKNWQTTSDALAAWLASQVRADELVLLKSVEAPPNNNGLSDAQFAEVLADVGIVDCILPRLLSPNAAVKIVNLRRFSSISIDC
ncbi:MAG: hypothetical protein KDB03_22110 [Planctomycetales bacterium]|nr:hypothetical protein [Planctomycetales bacterium]